MITAYDYVLTSAYCIDGASNIEVVFAVNETMDFSMISTEFGLHPDWNPEEMTGDAAWVKLPGSVNPSEYLFHRLLCLNFGSKFLAKRAQCTSPFASSSHCLRLHHFINHRCI